MSAAEFAGRVRQRTSRACTTCRGRKVKCDGKSPTCGRCAYDNVTCIYADSNRRQRISHLQNSRQRRISTAELTSPPEVMESTQITVEHNESNGATSQRETSVTATPSLDERRSLFAKYFDCIHPIWPILYKPLYHSINIANDETPVPEALANAIMSIAATIKSSSGDSASMPDRIACAGQYFSRAIVSLQGSNGDHSLLFRAKSTVLHCQVFTLLALQQHGIGALRQATVLCGVAAGMAIDLKLYQALSDQSQVEAQIRSRLWWGLYVLESMLACETSRPMMLNHKEADIPFPSCAESDEFDLYVSRSTKTLSTTPQKTYVGKLRTISAFHQCINLTMIMERISRKVYSAAARRKIRQDRRAGEMLRLSLWKELQDWQKGSVRPSSSHVSGQQIQSLPVSVTNEVFMWSTTILLHRPFIEHWQQEHPSYDIVDLVWVDPFEICLSAANQICGVLEVNTSVLEELPCDLIFHIYNAANVFLRAYQNPDVSGRKIRQQLKQCIEWIQILGQNWNGAEARQVKLEEALDLLHNRDGEHEIGDEMDTPIGTRMLLDQECLEAWDWVANMDSDANGDIFNMSLI